MSQCQASLSGSLKDGFLDFCSLVDRFVLPQKTFLVGSDFKIYEKESSSSL